ncbi:ZnMc domain-containing protein [Fusarium keratoplasticum]|nr:ZnMc domain-containing protein [Fusarium keratoplasticum]
MERIARTYCKDAVIPSSGKTAIEEAIYQEQPRGLDNVVITLPTKLWSRGRQAITYGWIDGEHSGSQAQRQKVAVVIEEWEWYSNVSFIAAGDSVARPDIVIAFDPSPSQGTWSLVGTDCLKAAPRTATMNLGCIGSDNEMAAAEKAVILHQFGHALGMLHEHQCPANGGIALTGADALVTLYGSQGWGDADVKEHMRVHLSVNGLIETTLTGLDTQSIMHFPLPGVITGRDFDIDYNYELSDMDKAYIALMYPRSWPSQRAPQWTLEAALRMIGLTQQTPSLAEKIKELAKTPGADGSIDSTKIRDLVFKWVTWFHTPGHATAGDSLLSQSPAPRHDASDRTSHGRRMERMEYSDKLMKEYLDAQKDWERKRDEMIGGSIGDQHSDPVTDLKKRLSNMRESEQARLASKYPDT